MSTNGLPPQPNSTPSMTTGKRTARRAEPPRWCSACRQPIRDQFLLYSQRDDKYWHQRCLKCDHCGLELDPGGSGGPVPRTYWTRGGRNFCLRDYQQLVYRQQSGLCAACKCFISASDLVVKITSSLIYHPSCLYCSICHGKLSTGDKFILSKDGSGGIICSQHTGPPISSNSSTTTGSKSKAKNKFKPPPSAQ